MYIYIAYMYVAKNTVVMIVIYPEGVVVAGKRGSLRGGDWSAEYSSGHRPFEIFEALL
jgi:hypothetical protein